MTYLPKPEIERDEIYWRRTHRVAYMLPEVRSSSYYSAGLFCRALLYGIIFEVEMEEEPLYNHLDELTSRIPVIIQVQLFYSSRAVAADLY